jgi:2-amino-4-hydroxy-6-hydroxymethyldihydropteridine diphosphokinase
MFIGKRIGMIMGSDQNEKIYLSLGSNLGDRLKNLLLVEEKLPPQVQVLKKSAVYETEPWGYLDQPKFLNQVFFAQTSLSPLELLAHIKVIEKEVGRKPTFLYGPRKVDIDILIYGDHLINDEVLTIPHKRLTERAFVLVPLAELTPDMTLPGTGKSIKGFLEQVDRNVVSIYQE